MITISERKKPYVVLVSILIIVSGVLSIFYSMSVGRRPIRTPRHEALAARLAAETARLLNNKGQILLLDAEAQQAKVPAAIERRAYFVKHIEHSGAIKIVAVENAKFRESIGHGDRGFAAEQFFAILKNHPNLDAIVSLAGPPELSDEQVSQLPPKLPKLIVVSGINKQVRPLMNHGLLQIAIVPRFTPLDGAAKDPKTKADWFDRYHQVVNAENVAALPY